MKTKEEIEKEIDRLRESTRGFPIGVLSQALGVNVEGKKLPPDFNLETEEDIRKQIAIHKEHYKERAYIEKKLSARTDMGLESTKCFSMAFVDIVAINALNWILDEGNDSLPADLDHYDVVKFARDLN